MENDDPSYKNYITPKFIELADNLRGVTDPEQLFFLMKFRMALVQVNLKRGAAGGKAYLPPKENTLLNEHHGNKDGEEYAAYMKEWKFTCQTK